jgi:hypothetical protein
MVRARLHGCKVWHVTLSLAA